MAEKLVAMPSVKLAEALRQGLEDRFSSSGIFTVKPKNELFSCVYMNNHHIPDTVWAEVCAYADGFFRGSSAMLDVIGTARLE